MLHWLRDILDRNFGRSSKWPALAKQHLLANPRCVVCGTTNDLQVHHIYPVHVFPELELAAGFLRTCCRECHLCVGHGGDWKAYNPNFDADVGVLVGVLNRIRKSRLYSRTSAGT